MSDFSSVYSGRALADVPFDHLWEGIPVAGLEFTEGKIVGIIRTDQSGKPVQLVKVRWTDGDRHVTDTMLHNEIRYVKVK